MMKILVLHSELGVLRGGGENFTRNLFAAFHKRGHQVVAAFLADKGGHYPLSMPAGIEPIPLAGGWRSELGQASLSFIGRWVLPNGWLKPKWERLQGAIHWRTHRWHNRRFQNRVEYEFAGRWANFDVIYVHSSVGLASSVSRYRPTILRLPGPVSPQTGSLLRNVHVVCANGDALIRTQQIVGDHAIELPIGIDTQLFSPGPTSIRQTLGWAEHQCIIGYVGRLLHLKGVDLLATAFRDISRLSPNVRLLIIGSGEKASLIRSILREELARGLVHMEFDVSHHRLPAWYRAMNLFVMPSRYENFSNAILEAVACGVPFLASDVGGNRTLAKDVGGFLFEKESVESLVLSLRNIIDDSSQLKRHGFLGCEYVKRLYTWEASADCLERIINSRLGVKGP